MGGGIHGVVHHFLPESSLLSFVVPVWQCCWCMEVWASPTSIASGRGGHSSPGGDPSEFALLYLLFGAATKLAAGGGGGGVYSFHA